MLIVYSNCSTGNQDDNSENNTVVCLARMPSGLVNYLGLSLAPVEIEERKEVGKREKMIATFWTIINDRT